MSDLLPVPLATAASFFLTSLIIELTPGPNMTYLALVSASEGRRTGFATLAGITLGLAIIGAIAAFGLAEAIQTSHVLYETLRWAGAVFLLYLAWESWRDSRDGVTVESLARGKYFARGFITNLLNPKAGVFYIAVLPSFIDAQLPLIPQAMTLTAIYVAVATLVHGVIVVLAGTLEAFLNNERRERVARRIFSVLLAAVAVWFAITTAR